MTDDSDLSKKKKRKKIFLEQDAVDDGTGTETGSGGKSGGIEFREFIKSSESLRDDLLTGEEKRRYLGVHERQHEGVVKKQKSLQEDRKKLKEGKVSLAAHRSGLSAASQNSKYKSHPVLSQKAQFSGIDRQVNALPEENVADTNNENRNELQHRYELKHQPHNQPSFNPQPIKR